MTDRFSDNADQGRFELDVDGRLTFADYRREAGTLVIPYVEAEPKLRGTGASARLLQQVAQVAKDEDRKVVPICGYAAAWFRRNARDLLA